MFHSSGLCAGMRFFQAVCQPPLCVFWNGVSTAVRFEAVGAPLRFVLAVCLPLCVLKRSAHRSAFFSLAVCLPLCFEAVGAPLRFILAVRLPLCI